MSIARLAVRHAAPADLPALHAIAERAVWVLLAGRHYSLRQTEAARAAQAYDVEPELVEDGTYYLVEVDGVTVGGSGWSPRGGFHPPLVGGAAAEVARPPGVAVMRASYVDPDWSRHGLGTLLARTTETAAGLAGFTSFEAMCSPASEALRGRLGYRLLERVEVPLIDGIGISMAHMRKDLTPVSAASRAVAGHG